MRRVFNIFRYFSFMAIICSLIGSLLLFFVGGMETYSALQITFLDYSLAGHENLPFSDTATAHLLKALDTFLIALVLFIFARGIYILFISNKGKVENDDVLKWNKTPNIKHLKNVLAEVTIIILFVVFLEVILKNIDDLRWEFIIIPVSILLLALGLKYLALDKDEH